MIREAENYQRGSDSEEIHLKGVCSDGAFDQFGDSRIPGAGSDCDDAAQE